MKSPAVLALLAPIAAVPAQAQCAATGPDLVVAELGAITVFSTAGGVTALMPQIALCNVGSAPADWNATTAAHPAIAFTLYRWSDPGGLARFEVVGQSWAHHQSSALQQALCCTCTPASLNELGAGCSTTSTASAVGSQSQLGLRSGIDPWSGAVAWPLGNPAPASGADRRLQVATSDLTPGARYFLEAHIVSGDDAAAANRVNNASHRELTVAAGGALQWIAPTVVGAAAIESLPSIDPQAAVSTTTVPGEGGTLHLGSRVIDLGDGFHAYELVLHAFDTHAGVRSFSVPIPVGVAVRNVAFGDADRHSGDPVGDADWTFAQTADRITWSTADATTDPLANALRWGSAFRFRFEAAAPPQNGSIELARFRPGTPDAWTIAGPVPSDPTIVGAYCFGDSSGTACPCGNASPPGANAGCLSSLGVGGRLVRSGTPSIALDTLVLSGSAMPSSTALYFLGTARVNGGNGAAFGDGLRCVTGIVQRLGLKSNVGGASSHPSPGDPAISVAGGIAAGDTRHFQVWYRNAATFCTAATYNLTNGVSATWTP